MIQWPADMTYIAVEGGCYAGKTTTIEYLSGQSMEALPELHVSDGLPPCATLSPSLEGYMARTHALIKAEEKRTERVDALRSRADILLADRSTLSAFISHDVGLRLGLGDPDDRKRAFEYGATQLAVAQAAGRIVLPDAVLVMSLASREEFYRRAAERAGRNPREVPSDLWTRYEPNYLSTERIYAYASAIWGDSAAKIEIYGGEQKLAVGAAVLELVRSLPPAGEVVSPREMLQ